MEALRKYRVVLSKSSDEFEDKLNALAEVGYGIRYVDTENYPFAVMELPDKPDLAQATNFVKVEHDANTKDGTPLIEQLHSKGWRIMSEYSKHVNMAYFPNLREKKND